LHNLADTLGVNASRQVPGRMIAVNNVNKPLPALEIHVPHGPTFALPDEAEHFAALICRRTRQAIDGENEDSTGTRQLGDCE
jgi:hypothetical protein